VTWTCPRKAKRLSAQKLQTEDRATKGGDAPTILVADDHGLIREGLKIVLERDGMRVVGFAATGRQAVEMTQSLEPDVVILDIRMPDMDGLEALAAIKSARPETTVLMLTSYGNPEYLYRSISLGAAGFLTKEGDPNQISQAIRTVIEGESIIDSKLLRDSLKALSAATGKPSRGMKKMDVPSLTEQEIRILTLIAEGLTNADIADALCVSPNTVKTHVHNIFVKLGVSDRTQAALWAIRRGLVA